MLHRGGVFKAGAWWILVFVLMWFPSMGEIKIMCDMYMDEVGIPMLVTMSKRITYISLSLCIWAKVVAMC